MIEDTEQRRRRSVSREKFDQQYSNILGALRAKMPFAYNAAQFAYGTSGLTHQPTIDETLILLNDLEGLLTNLGNGIAKETQELIRYDIQTLSRMILEQKLTLDQLKPKLKNLRRLWPDLILGQIPIKQILNRKDEVKLWLASSAIGILLFSGVAAIVVAPFGILFEILSGLGFVSTSTLTYNISKDLITLFGSLLTLLTGIGVSFSFFYRKAGDWLRGFVSSFTVRLAKGRSLR
jgi:hypothetical protein